MALSTSPRKVIPLATGDEPRPRSTDTSNSSTKRAFFCGVVVEGSEGGRRLPDEIQDLVLSLGTLLESETETDILSSNEASQSQERPTTRKRALTDSSALASVIQEFVTTERTYVRRLRSLKTDYADPLRNFARSKNTAIIPSYIANILFGNIDSLIPVNEAFLTDLEKMLLPNGSALVGGIGDVALRHFKERRGFEHYKHFYTKREEAQTLFKQEVSKRSSPFAAYIDRIKYQSADSENRIGLRELLMEPVQRIPRYTLLFRTMIKHMAPHDPQRVKLLEADEIASKIALAEADEHTTKAAIFACLISSIEGFPSKLFSHSRQFIDCIDVEDTLMDNVAISSSASIASTSSGSLHCSLVLFDDKLLIVKRPSGDKGIRTLSGLEDLEKLTKAGGIPSGRRKSGMSCKGVMDITDVTVTDVNGADLHMYLENPPYDQTDRWSGRPFRSLSVVRPPSPVNLEPTQTAADKRRFLENLWTAQARYRTKAGQSVVLCSDDMEVESKGGRVTVARTYYNVYQRTAFLQEDKKTKVLLHIDALGTADGMSFGVDSAPFVIIRLQPLAGGVCRYKVTSSDPTDEGEDDVVQSTRVPSRILWTIHQFGLFEFRTGRNNSRPSTPTAKSKVSIFGLDAISRNLFNSRSGPSMGDFFAGSVNSNRRSKSTASRSSAYTQSTSTGDGSLTGFSHRSNSTAATTVSSSGNDDTSFFSRSPKRKLVKRGISPGPSEDEQSFFRRSLSRSPSRSRASSRGPCENDYSDVEDQDGTVQDHAPTGVNASDRYLEKQLDLARRNSQTQNERQAPMTLEAPSEATIYEDEPPQPIRPASRASRDSNSQHTITQSISGSPPRQSRSADRRPMGPRTASPLPPRSPQPSDQRSPDDDDDYVASLVPVPPPKPTGIPRSKRQPLNPVHPSGSRDETPRPTPVTANLTGSSVEPLSIKKKSSVRSSVAATGSPAPRRNVIRSSPMSRTTQRIVSPRRISPRTVKAPSHQHSSLPRHEDFDYVIQLAQTTKEDVESSHRAVKRIKLEVESFRTTAMKEEECFPPRPSSPSKVLRTPQRTSAPVTQAAQERMEEMRKLLSQRGGDTTPRGSIWMKESTPSRGSSAQSPSIDCDNKLSRTVDTLVIEAERDLARAVSDHDALQNALKQVTSAFKEKVFEIDRVRVELQNAKRQCEAVKILLQENTAEKDIMYEAFNEELDNMYNDLNLPDDEAWTAMTNDLRNTKEARNNLAKENSELKRQFVELELQHAEWGALLRSNSLIS